MTKFIKLVINVIGILRICPETSSRTQWLRGSASDSTTRTRVRILCCGVKILGKLFHSTLLLSTQLYK